MFEWPAKNILLNIGRIWIVAFVFVFVLDTVRAGPASATDELPDALSAGWQGEKVCELMHEDENIRALRCSFRPGQGHERHFHPPHFGYVLSGGTMRIEDSKGSREVLIQTDSIWASDGVDWHQAENVGDTTQRYLIIEKKY